MLEFCLLDQVHVEGECHYCVLKRCCLGNLQPFIASLNSTVRDKEVVSDSPVERGVERGPGPHVGGVRRDSSDDVAGVASEVVVE